MFSVKCWYIFIFVLILVFFFSGFDFLQFIMASFDLLVKRRGYARQRVTKIHNDVESNLEELTEQDRLVHIDRLSQLKKELLDLDEQILTHVVDKQEDSAIQKNIKEDEAYQQKIVTSKLPYKENKKE